EFAATYLGEGPNTNAATDVSCDTSGANGEQVTVVGAATSSTAQRWLPNDRITLNSSTGTVMNGTLTATLYKGTFTVTSGVCTIDTAVSTGFVFTLKFTNNACPIYYSTPNTTI